MTALHACNTATDDAIRFALTRNARHIVLVPCCQAEVAAAMRAKKSESLSKTPLAELWRHPIHTRELGSHLTNVLRCLLLESHGYDVTVTEPVSYTHLDVYKRQSISLPVPLSPRSSTLASEAATIRASAISSAMRELRKTMPLIHSSGFPPGACGSA